MKYKTILISGTPASGKDTLSDKLLDFRKDLVNFKKHKGCDDLKKTGNYHYISISKFNEEIKKGNFIQYHKRYGNYYGIHNSEINRLIKERKIPIIHVGKYENLLSILENKRIENPLSILFYLPKKETIERLEYRHSGNALEIKERIKAYDEEIDQLKSAYKNDDLLRFHIAFKNDSDEIEKAVLALIEHIENSNPDYIKKSAIEDIISNGK